MSKTMEAGEFNTVTDLAKAAGLADVAALPGHEQPGQAFD